MTEHPFVTVAIPTRNRPALALRAAGAALAQTGVDIEVLVIDDGSDEPSADTLADLAHADSRLRVIRNEIAEGVASARNRAIEEAAGEWVGFCDDDDMWAPSKTEQQVGGEGADGAVWTCSGAIAVDPALTPLYAMRVVSDEPGFQRALLERNLVPGGGSSVLARTAVMRRLGGFDPALSALADWDMWIRLSDVGPPAGVDRPLVAYVIHPGGMSADVELLLSDMSRMRTKHRSKYESAGVGVDDHMWVSYLAYRTLRTGRRLAAARMFLRAASTRRTFGPLAAAGVSLISPAWLMKRRAAIVRDEIPEDWRAEVLAWLANFRTSPMPPYGPSEVAVERPPAA